MSLEGKIQIQADLAPNGDNPRMPVTDNKYVKGAPQVFDSIATMVAFHPNRMSKGMPATVTDYPSAGTITDFRLAIDPTLLLDSNNDSIVTVDNFEEFWNVQSQTLTNYTRVYQYSADGPGGGTPVYPYTIGQEPNWANVFDSSKGHKWLRFRDDDVDDNEDGIFDNWTIPIQAGAQFQNGDYIENRFRRQAISATVHSGIGTMTADKYYIIEQGSIQIDGDLSLNDIGQYGATTTAIIQSSRIFKYAAANTYTFLSSATVTETLKPPPRTVGGLPNNEPAGWTDSIPGGTDQLWQISAQKSVYGQLKSTWSIRKITENINYVRYSNAPSPHPDTIAGVNTTVTSGNTEDLALIAAGWVTAFDSHVFIAVRSDDPGVNLYTPWLVEKISDESGEYTDRVFKLFDINLDSDSVFLIPPTLRDPTAEGWNDTPLIETTTQINYISEARKFFNGELKSSWSQPVPYTGKDVFIDSIKSDLGDNFKYDQIGGVSPAAITLTAYLHKGPLELWENAGTTITYSWVRVYNDSSIDTEVPTSNPADDFYTLGTSGTQGTGNYFHAGQRVVIKPGAVTGNAVFECTQTIIPAQGDPIVFVDEYSILDITDGIDAKSIAVRADSQLVLFDSVNAIHAPEEVNLRVYQSNIPSPTFYWYKWNGSSWVKFTTADDNNLFPNGVNGNTLKLDIFAGTETVTTDLVLTVPGSGADATITSAGSELPAMVVSDEFEIRNHSDVNNNGLYVVVTVNTSTSDYEVNKISGDAPTTAAAESASVFTDPTYIFSPNQTKEEGMYAVSTHSTNPDSADYITTFTDYITVSKTSSAGVGSNGVDSLSALLDNESHTVILVESTGLPFPGEINSAPAANDGRAFTTLGLYDGSVKKIYTTDYTIAVETISVNTGTLTDVEFSYAANGNDVDIFVDEWFSPARAAKCKITITYGAYSLQKIFTISSTLDAPGAMLLDIDSDKGYIFTPSDKTDITLTANLYDTSLSGDQLVTLPDASYTFRWNVAGVWGSTDDDNYTKVITNANILVSSVVTVEVYKDAVLFRSRTITMTDVNDGRSYRAWTSNVTKPSTSQDLSAQDPTGGGWPYTISGVVWRLPSDTHWLTNTPTFAQDATEAAGVFTWLPVYQLKGEKGDQGPNGDFVFPMYKVEDPGPPALGAGGTTSTLAQMLSASWLSKPPASGIIWRTERLWEGEGVTFNGSGDPSTAPVSGGTWSSPIRLSAKNGTNGTNGVGINGWSPIFGIVDGVSPGQKVMQLTGWTGGTGSNPGSVGFYVGASGFVSSIASAVIIKNIDYYTEHFQTVTEFPHTDVAINSSSGVSIKTLVVPTATYQRRIRIRANVLCRRGGSVAIGQSTPFLGTLQASINGGGYSTCTPLSALMSSNVNDAGLGETMTVYGSVLVSAGQTCTLRFLLSVLSGENSFYTQPVIVAETYPEQ